MRILVVDDEPGIRRALRAGFGGLGHEVSLAGGATALLALADDRVEVVILDLGLPDIDGIEVIGRVRRWSKVPIIVLSVKGDQAEKIQSLDAGADDYVEKPFAMGELAARIGAIVRRSEPYPAESILRFGELEFDQPKTLVHLSGERIALTPTEFKLLEALVTNPEKLLTHGGFCGECGGRVTGTRASTCGSTSGGCVPSWATIRRIRDGSLPTPGSGTDGSRRPHL